MPRPRGFKHSEKTLAKMRGRKHTPEAKEKIGAAGRGRKHKAESIEKMKKSVKRGPASNLWRGGRMLKCGYVYLFVPEHPLCNTRGYVQEHRLVMEKKIGRLLRTGEMVHHLNGVRDDNRPENLELILVGQTHAGWVLCPHCDRRFLIK